ncbi:MAG: hypothetical protein MJ154_02315 [Candidatus Saccharibacteria bacterium]|nr:hypothetical protein [Candidatus Saccharibacteria bacterium]
MAKSKIKQAVEQMNPRTRIAIILIIVLFAFAIIYSLSVSIYRAGKSKTQIHYAPNAANVYLNDVKVTNNSTSWIIPGEYHLKVEFNDHFSTHEEDITIETGTTELYGILSALDDEGREYEKQHRQEFAIVEGLVGSLLSRQGQKIKEENPILNYLPINNSLYSISYQYDENNKPVVYVKSDPKYLEVAVAKMKLFDGVELSSQNIVFLNKSPFDTYQQNPIKDIKKFLRAAYQLNSDYKINDVKQIGDYYYTTFYTDNYNTNANHARYIAVVKENSDGNWEVISTPQPILTIFNTPELDVETLKTINSY